MDLISGLSASVLWLALNVYHEARSESFTAQMAVAHVTINRAKEAGTTIKKVVTKRKQFSWTSRLHSYRLWYPREKAAFKQAVQVARQALSSQDFTGGAKFYHADYVKPPWARKKDRKGKWGRHIFY